MKNKKMVMIVFIIMVLIISIFPSNVNADLGPKPSITIKIDNLNTKNYIIDLLIYPQNAEEYYPDTYYSNYGRDYNKDEPGEIDKNGITVHFDKIAEDRNITIDQVKQLYYIDYDGWISASTRNWALWGTCNGNKEYVHEFNYLGVPKRYKVIIINNDTGIIKVSDEIIKKDFASKVTIDYNSLSIKGSVNIKNNVLILLMTIAIELIIALLMKYKKYIKVIVMTNFATNVSLQLLLLFIISGNYLINLILFEIIVFITEYLVYKKFMKEESSRKILIYTLLANVVTASLTFIIK